MENVSTRSDHINVSATKASASTTMEDAWVSQCKSFHRKSKLVHDEPQPD